MGDPYLILTNPQHEYVYTGEQLASYIEQGTKIP